MSNQRIGYYYISAKNGKWIKDIENIQKLVIYGKNFRQSIENFAFRNSSDDAKARELKAQGRKIISLSIGEPDFNTPEVITEAAIDALRKHETDHYTPALGLDKLRQAICDFHKRKDRIDLQKEQVATFAGAKFALYSVFMTLVDPGTRF